MRSRDAPFADREGHGIEIEFGRAAERVVVVGEQIAHGLPPLVRCSGEPIFDAVAFPIRKRRVSAPHPLRGPAIRS